MSMDKKQFNQITGAYIQKARGQKQLTRERLAESAGISSKYLYEIEVGNKGCSGYILYSLAEALQVNIESLFPVNSKGPK